ncbi:MAG TPA: hypothetical protein VFI65_10515 [Streptosporangiaceae bacterium]|nr:hypothetical protein [Streptosporangiaceae bacterium]
MMHWDGTTWSVAPPPSLKRGADYQGSAVAPDGTAWAVGSTGVEQTLAVRWNGRAWTRERALSPVAGSVLNGVAATSPTNAWAVGSVFGSQSVVDQVS